MKVRTPSGQVYRIRRRWGLWRWSNVSARMPDEAGITGDQYRFESPSRDAHVYAIRRSGIQSGAGFVLIAALVQAVLLPVLLPIAIALRTFFGKPWMVQVRWADVRTEIKGGSWSESTTLINSLAGHVKENGSLIGTPLFPK